MVEHPSLFAAGKLRIAVLQVAPVFLNATATWEKIKSRALEAIAGGAEVLVWGESLIPGYPNWPSFDLSQRQETLYALYWDQALTLDGPIIADVKAFAKEHNVMLMGGIAEREGGSTFATAITVGANGELLGRHRKLKPTWKERLVWADGDGAGLKTYETKIGRIGILNCWENWLPLARAVLHQQGEFIHVSVWPGNENLVKDIGRFIALEAKSWSIVACGLLRSSDMAGLDPDLVPFKDEMMAYRDVWQNGGSRIIAPNGEVVAGPLFNEEGVIMADLDARAVIEARQLLDHSGHYSRADILSLQVVPNAGSGHQAKTAPRTRSSYRKD